MFRLNDDEFYAFFAIVGRKSRFLERKKKEAEKLEQELKDLKCEIEKLEQEAKEWKAREVLFTMTTSAWNSKSWVREIISRLLKERIPEGTVVTKGLVKETLLLR